MTTNVGSSVNIADETAAGEWTSGNTTIASADDAGLVIGLSAGTAVISHVVTSADGEIFTTITSIEVTDLPMDLHLFPNPTNGAFTVKGTLGIPDDEEVFFEITDVLGQVIYKNKTTALKGKVNETISLNSSLANGIYMLDVQSRNEKTVFHFVMEK